MDQNSVGYIEVQDAVLWPMNIKGDPLLAARLKSLVAGDVVILRVAGKLTAWERMRDGKDGRPTLGLKPRDAVARELWSSLFPSHKGEKVSISEAE